MNRLLARSFLSAVFSVLVCMPVFAQTDQALLDNLIQVTSSGHVFRKGLVSDAFKIPAPEPARVAARFDPVVEANTKLTPEQKQFAKANYPKLAQMVTDRMQIVASKYFQVEIWLDEYLRETYAKEMTAAEMRTWIDYFKTPDGQRSLAAVLAYPQPTDPEGSALLKKFEQTAIGAKFIRIFGSALNARIQSKLAEVGPTVKEALTVFLSPEELNTVLEKFVAENYKTP